MDRYRRTFETGSLALILVAATIVLWGVMSPLVKATSLSGPALSFHRLWIGSVALLLVLRATGQPASAGTAKWSLIAGAVFALNLLSFVVAIKLTTVANATLIGALQPAIVLLAAGRMFGERVGPREIAAAGVAIGGVALVIIGGSGAPEWNPAGDALALVAVLTYTAYFLVSKQVRASVAALPYVTGVHAVAALLVTPLALTDPAGLVSFTPADVAIVLVFALVSGTGGQLVINWAHRYVDVSVSSLMMLGVPVAAAIVAWLMLGESLNPVQLVGGAITLAGIALIVLRTTSGARAATAPDAGAATGEEGAAAPVARDEALEAAR